MSMRSVDVERGLRRRRSRRRAAVGSAAAAIAVSLTVVPSATAAGNNPIGAITQPSYYGVSDPVTWDDQTLYIAGVGVPRVQTEGGTNLTASGWSGRFTTDADGNVASSRVSMQQGWTVASTGALTSGDSQITTMAVDAGNFTGQSRAYYWSWAAANGVQAPGVQLPPRPAGAAGSWKAVRAFDAGETTATQFVVPSPFLAATHPDHPQESDRPRAYDYWSGGEVFQRTGELYFGGGECAGLGRDYRMMIFDPSDGSYLPSGKIEPATPSDAIFGTANGCGGRLGYVGSDFALDSAGNAYLLVLGRAPATGDGSQWAPLSTAGAPVSQLRGYVVRVVPGDHNSGWTYNVVTMLSADPNETSSAVRTFAGRFGDGSGAPTAATLANLYGAAFLNGKLYVGAMNAGANLYAIDTISGYTTHVRDSTGSTISPVSDVRDLASGQTASVIQGVVYDSPDGTSKRDARGVSGQTIALYRENADGSLVLAGTRLTDGSGNYSFLTGGPGTYIVRLVQPQIGGVNAVQTYASAGHVAEGASGDAITVTAACFVDGHSTAMTTSGPCAGNLPIDAYVDPNLGPIGSTIAAAETARFPVQSRAVVTGTSAIFDTNFGISAVSSFGDAQNPPYRTTIDQQGPRLTSADPSHLHLGELPGRYLDGTPDANASAHPSDDGISLLTESAGPRDLQGEALASGKSYPVRADVRGTLADRAHVRGWQARSTDTAVTGGPVFSAKAVEGVADGTLVAPILPSGMEQIQARFIAAPDTVELDANDNLSGLFNPARGSQAADTRPWAVPGEVEDVAYHVAPAIVRVGVDMEHGETPVTFEFSLDNVIQSDVSSNTATITVENTETSAFSTAVHAVSSVGSPVGITGVNIPENVVLLGAACTDTVTGEVKETAVDADSATVTPQLGDDVTCRFSFSTLEPTLPITGEKTVAPVAGDLMTVETPSPDNWEITVADAEAIQVINGNGEVRVDRDVTYTLGERLRSEPAPEASAALYAQKGPAVCTDAHGDALPGNVFDADRQTLTVGARDAIATPIRCRITNQSAHVGLFVKQVGGPTESPAEGWALTAAHAGGQFDFALDADVNARQALPAEYALTAATPDGLSIVAVQRLDLDRGGCRAGVTDPDGVDDSCWSPATLSEPETIRQGHEHVFRILAASPRDVPGLPLTGGIGSWIFLVSAAGVLIAAAITQLIRRRGTHSWLLPGISE
ncbi:hypothetical protein [Microbacterium thalli]|uniref:hypothetical protein n=1 Tax=Microbacterium thalli TaxID=3027921 RepID=UPI0023666C3B|nr:hypothetical protein [Microbacterium thalli]MDD7929832.1 hypothetical protein [Microbacterium thalli]